MIQPRGAVGPARNGAQVAGMTGAGGLLALYLVDQGWSQPYALAAASTAAMVLGVIGSWARDQRHAGGHGALMDLLLRLAVLLGCLLLFVPSAHAQPVLVEAQEPTTNEDNPATITIDESQIPLADLEAIELVVTDEAGEVVGEASSPATSPSGGGSVQLTVDLEPGEYLAVARARSLAGRVGVPSRTLDVTVEAPQPLPSAPVLVRITVLSDGSVIVEPPSSD